MSRREEHDYKKLRDELKKNKTDEKNLRRHILDEIKSDRELVALKSGRPSTTTTQTTATTQLSPTNTVTTYSTIIQIKNLDGSRLRIVLRNDDTLLRLWDEVEARTDIRRSEFLLIQPYPRKVFDEISFSSTLVYLGLSPNANLAFERKAAMENAFMPQKPHEFETLNDAPPESDDNDVGGIDNDAGGNGNDVGGIDNDAGGIDNDAGGNDNDVGGIDNDAGGIDNDVGGNDNDGEEEEADEPRLEPNNEWERPNDDIINVDDDDDNDDSSDDDDDLIVPPNDWDPRNWGQPHQHLWGPGFDMVERVFNQPDLSYQNRNRNELAAEAALSRLIVHQHQQQQSNQTKKIVSSLLTARSAHSLKDLSLYSLLSTIVASRPPYNIGDLPACLAEDIIAILVKEGALKPNHLRHFVRCHLHRMVLDNFKYCTNEILHALKKHVGLEHLSLKNSVLVTDEGLKSLASLKNLKLLNLSGCAHATDCIIPTIIGLSHLEVLDLEKTCITDSGVRSLCEARPSKLTTLSLKATSITQNILIDLSLIPKLKCLNLEACQLSDIQGIENINTLVDLNLANTFVTTDTISRLRNMSQLKSLSLTNTPEISSNKALFHLSNLKLKNFCLPNRFTLTDKGIPYLSNMPLVSLDLSHYIYLTNEAMIHVGQITTLRKLFLTNTKITDEGLMLLSNLKELRELNLNRSHITDNGAILFQSLPKLFDLSLSMTSITDQLIMKNFLTGCKFLKKLNLSSTQVTMAGITALNISSLKVLNIDETYVDPYYLPTIPGCPSLTKIVCKTQRMAQ